jgi:heavy metal translocating P-type ATPase
MFGRKDATLAAPCAHCGLTVAARAKDLSEPVYCCTGCRLAAAARKGDDGPRDALEGRLVFATFLAMGVMAGNLVLYGEDVYARGDEPGLAAVRRLAQIGTAVFAVPVFLLLGVPLFRGALSDLRRGAVRMDGLVVLATVAAYVVSVAHTFAGEGAVYYETAVGVLVAVTLGRRLEAHARTEGRAAAAALAELLPEKAFRIDVDGERTVAPDELAAGDRVRVPPGAAFPAESRIVAGAGSYSAAHVTGEATPVDAGIGSLVPAGAVAGPRGFEAIVVAPWREGVLGRIRALLDAPTPLTRVVRKTDALAGRLALLSVGLAVFGGVRSGLVGGAGDGLRTALSVLLCACPCALGLATPLAYRAIRAALARRGVLARDPAALENAADASIALVDKTGTLTAPTPSATYARDVRNVDRLAALAAASGHPLGAALIAARGGADEAGAVEERAASPASVADVELVPGRGARGVVDGVPIVCGAPAWLDAEGVSFPPELARALDLESARGSTLVAAAEEGRATALVAFSHVLRPHAVATTEALRARGVEIEIVSGDRDEAVADVAGKLGVRFVARAAPADKAARVATLREEGVRVMAVGDGVNDAPFLKAADVGVAVQSGTAAARVEAQIELSGDDLRGLPILIDAARALRRNVRGNVFWTLAYNGVALFFATAGKLHPLLAAAAMTASSVVVAIRAHRLLGFDPCVGSTPPTPAARVVAAPLKEAAVA